MMIVIGFVLFGGGCKGLFDQLLEPTSHTTRIKV